MYVRTFTNFCLTLALGLRYLGVLLMGALIIIPATTAKRVAGSLSAMLITAVAVVVFATVAGSHRHRGRGVFPPEPVAPLTLMKRAI
jgi:ABC-type Mn2+/Zn2+ transport system permease subunit